MTFEEFKIQMSDLQTQTGQAEGDNSFLLVYEIMDLESQYPEFARRLDS
jgi:hypothetical protein